MHVKFGDMWDIVGETDLFCITANSTVRKSDEHLVMGRGIAREAAQRYPGLQFMAGKLVSAYSVPYGVIILPIKPFALFQVKTHWQHDAELSLIEHTVRCLLLHAKGYNTVDRNFPGIGNGKLLMEDVLPVIDCLGDNVNVWIKKG